MSKLTATGFWWGDKDELVLCLRNGFTRICGSMIDLEFRDFVSSMVEGGTEKLFIEAREKKGSQKFDLETCCSAGLPDFVFSLLNVRRRICERLTCG